MGKTGETRRKSGALPQPEADRTAGPTRQRTYLRRDPGPLACGRRTDWLASQMCYLTGVCRASRGRTTIAPGSFVGGGREQHVAIAGGGCGADTAGLLVPARVHDYCDVHVTEAPAELHPADLWRRRKKRVRQVTSQSG